MQAHGMSIAAPSTYFSRICCQNYAYCGGNIDSMCPVDVSNKPTTTTVTPRGTFHGFFSISRNEGVAALWRGLPPTLLMSVPATVVYFLGYEALRQRLDAHFQDTLTSSTWINHSPIIAGAFARTLAATLIAPVELVRTRTQAHQHAPYSVVFRDLSQAIHEYGWRSLWRGLTPTLWRDVPFSALYWMSYEGLKRYLTDAVDGRLSATNHKESMRTMVTSSLRARQPPPEQTLSRFSIAFFAGAVSGMVAAAVTTPFDVIKTRRQVAPDSSLSLSTVTASRSAEATMSTLALGKKIWTEGGWRAFLTGIGPRVGKVAPACAIMISSYEVGKSYLERRRTNR
jgi:solute carrier family 25 protein 39/40